MRQVKDLKAMKKTIPLLAACFLSSACAAGSTALYSSFVDPPRSAAPHVWWHWMNGNVSKDGITADLEAMKEIGLAGAQSFDCSCGIPFGGVKFASDEWFDLVLHAHNEAKRLGLELCLANCSGYSSSGGPWVTPEDSMKEIVVEEAIVKDGESPVLPVGVDVNGFYRDIAAVAFPTPEAIVNVSAGVVPEVALADEEKTKTFTFDFGAEREFSELSMKMDSKAILWGAEGRVKIVVEVPGADGSWRVHAELGDHATPASSICGQRRYYRFEKVRASKARVSVAFKYKSYCRRVAVSGVALGVFGRMPDYAARTLFFTPTSIHDAKETDVEKGVAVKSGSVLVLKPDFDGSGRLGWRAPKGRWTVLRVGYRCSGRYCEPASDFGRGLEVDKLDAAALERFFGAYVGKLVKKCGIDPKSDPVNRPGFNMVLVDSWEVGSQNWTKGFEDVFEKSRGYSIMKYLPVFTGYVVDSVSETDRVCRDFRLTVEESFAKNYADKFADLCHASGLLLEIEPYSPQPCSSARYARNVDCPMSEFWCVEKPDPLAIDLTPKYVASIGHVRGRKYLGAESFTSFAVLAGWRQTPWSYKAIGDIAYANGVNRIVYHRYAHQPWTSPDAAPGMTMGPWGTHFERTVTWWNYAKDWIKYQTRCQYMLQEGVYKADALVYVGSHETPRSRPVGPVWRESALSKKPILPIGYDWDFIGPDSLGDLVLTKDGKVKVPGGTEYSFIAVPDAEAQDVKLSGAKVVKFSEVADYLKENLKPAFETETKKLTWIRRGGYSGGEEAWFIATYSPTGCVADVTLRAESAAAPQIWDSVTGERTLASFDRLADGRVKVRFELGPCGSKFVVFGSDACAMQKSYREEKKVPVGGSWTVEFLEPRRGAPESISLDSLADLSAHAQSGVKFFSGTCVYRKSVKIDPAAARDCAKAVIDLGKVGEIARVKANGVYAPVIAWMKPARADITAGVRKAGSSGTLDLEIEVVNTWVNRIAGDIIDGFAPDWEWNQDRTIKSIPEYVKKGERAPSGRHCFYTYRHLYKSEKLPVSGLVGPVEINLSMH